MRYASILRLLILLAAPSFALAQFPAPGGNSGGGSSVCTLSGTQTAGYVLTALGGSACDWEAVGGASVDASTTKNAEACPDTSVSANTLTCSTSTTFPTLAAGQVIRIKVANTNTGATTITVSGGSSKAVTKFGSTALAAGNIVAGTEYLLGYDGTRWQVINPTLIAADIPTLNQNTSGTAANLSGTPALPNGTTGTTQSPGDGSTKLATDAYADASSTAAAAQRAPADAHYLTTQAESGLSNEFSLGGLSTGILGCTVSTSICTPSIFTALPNGFTATTQSASDNSTKVATTAYADAQAALRGTGNAAAAVTTTFSGTPTFTCPTSTKGTVTTFTLSTALTANITSSTLASCTTSQLLVFILTQDSTGSRTVAMPTGFDPAPISPTASKTTTLIYDWDGTNGHLLNSSDDTQSILFLTERSAPGTPAASAGVCWPDSTNHILSCKFNNSSTVSSTVVPQSCTNQAITAVSAAGVITCSTVSNAMLANAAMTIAGHSVSLGGSQAISASDVGLGSVTNDAQTKAAIVPNTAPSAGQVPTGNAGGTAYAPQTLSGSCTLASTGVITCTRTVEIGCGFDGNGSTITTNAICYTRVPVLGTITGWAIEAKGSSPALTIDVLKIASGATLPTSSIAASALPALTSTDNAAKSTAVSTWCSGTPAGCLSADDIVGFKVTVPGAATWAAIHLYYTTVN